MRSFSSQFLRHISLFLVSVFSLTLLLGLPSVPAQAAAVACRTDPIVTLSNGDVVIILVDIATAPENVTRIDYKLHVPKGVTATNIIYTGVELGLVENLVLVDDANEEYKSETVVRVAKSVSVVATMIYDDEVVTVSGKGGKVIKASIEISQEE